MKHPRCAHTGPKWNSAPGAVGTMQNPLLCRDCIGQGGFYCDCGLSIDYPSRMCKVGTGCLEGYVLAGPPVGGVAIAIAPSVEGSVKALVPFALALFVPEAFSIGRVISFIMPTAALAH